MSRASVHRFTVLRREFMGRVSAMIALGLSPSVVFRQDERERVPSVHDRLRADAASAPLAMQFQAGTADDCAAWQRQFRAKLLELLGNPKPPGRWTVEREAEVARSDHVREELILLAEGVATVPLHVLRPKTPPPWPAVQVNLISTLTGDELTNLFAQYGSVRGECWIASDELGRCLGFGYVEMSEGAEAAIATLNGSEFMGCKWTVHEAQPESARPDQIRLAEIGKRYAAHCELPESAEFGMVVRDFQKMAETANAEAAHQLADILASPGPQYNPEAAYKWYYFALSEPSYSVEFADRITRHRTTVDRAATFATSRW